MPTRVHTSPAQVESGGQGQSWLPFTDASEEVNMQPAKLHDLDPMGTGTSWPESDLA
jgi:hypothetical protein